jgi:hypothetical protein
MDVKPVLEAGDGPLADITAAVGANTATYTREAPGMSAFAREDGAVYHTYSAYATLYARSETDLTRVGMQATSSAFSRAEPASRLPT